MKKQTKFSILTAGVCSLLLTACGPSVPEITDWDNYFQIDQSKYKVTFNELRLAAGYDCEANQKGDVRALVVPIEFTNYTADALPAGREGTREDIDIAIFGNPETDKELGWESLHSFYQKSSYGQCNITGYTADWYNVNMRDDDFEKTNSTNQLIKDLHDYYFEGEGKAELEAQNLTLSDFDANNDGFADLVLTVYSRPQSSSGGGSAESIYWAYTTQSPNGKFAKPADETDALFSRYWWCSYDFMYKDTIKGGTSSYLANPELIKANAEGCIDAHTFIHETGHGLGLADYYSYDYNKDAPMGGIDMMDNNIGDHNAYSKALYGWISPYVVDGNARITIKPFETSGDAIIVPIREINWKVNKYTLLDEYLIIQYDTPEGLAKADGEDHYAGNYPLYYNVPGIRVLHTDSRMGAWYWDSTSKSKSFAQYVRKTKLNDPENKYTVDFAHDNTLSRTANGNRLLQVVHPDGQNHIRGILDNKVLWQEGTTLESYECNTLNPVTGVKYDLGFSIKVVSITPEGATLEFRTTGEVAEAE